MPCRLYHYGTMSNATTAISFRKQMTFCQYSMFSLPNDTNFNNFHRELFAVRSLYGRGLVRVTVAHALFIRCKLVPYGEWKQPIVGSSVAQPVVSPHHLHVVACVLWYIFCLPLKSFSRSFVLPLTPNPGDELSPNSTMPTSPWRPRQVRDKPVTSPLAQIPLHSHPRNSA